MIHDEKLDRMVTNSIKDNPEGADIIYNMTEKMKEYAMLGYPYGKTEDAFFDWYFDVYIDPEGPSK